ncbi:hypothetical protein ACOMHN_029051 [Nucella lapillus]
MKVMLALSSLLLLTAIVQQSEAGFLDALMTALASRAGASIKDKVSRGIATANETAIFQIANVASGVKDTAASVITGVKDVTGGVKHTAASAAKGVKDVVRHGTDGVRVVVGSVRDVGRELGTVGGKVVKGGSHIGSEFRRLLERLIHV